MCLSISGGETITLLVPGDYRFAPCSVFNVLIVDVRSFYGLLSELLCGWAFLAQCHRSDSSVWCVVLFFFFILFWGQGVLCFVA